MEGARPLERALTGGGAPPPYNGRGGGGGLPFGHAGRPDGGSRHTDFHFLTGHGQVKPGADRSRAD